MNDLAFSVPCPSVGISFHGCRTLGSSVYSSTFTHNFICPKRFRTHLPPRFSKTLLNSNWLSRAVPKASSASSEEETSQPPVSDRFRTIRKILVIFSFLGFSETMYLTYNKLFSSPGAICATQGCLDVLSGPFSSFLGIPLTLFGALAYAGFAYLSVWPLAADDETNEEGEVQKTAEEVYKTRDAATRPLMLALSIAMTVFSAYLMAILVFVIQDMCPYCVVSAIISSSMFILTAFVGRAIPAVREAFQVGAASTAIASVAASVLFFLGLPTHIRAQPPGGPQIPPAITMSSTSDTMVSFLKSSHFHLHLLNSEQID